MPGRIRRMMQRPGGRIAVRLGTGFLVGGALGAQVGGIVDQWAGAEGGAVAGAAGGGMGLGMMGFAADDGEGDFEAGQGEFVEEEYGYGGAGQGGREDGVESAGGNFYADQGQYIEDGATWQEYSTDGAGAPSDEASAGGDQTGYVEQGGGGGGCIEDDIQYSSMAVNGGYNVQY